ncbi:MAG: hypothetical protein ACM3UZ_01670 [Acidobacteriota bacterium]
MIQKKVLVMFVLLVAIVGLYFDSNIVGDLLFKFGMFGSASACYENRYRLDGNTYSLERLAITTNDKNKRIFCYAKLLDDSKYMKSISQQELVSLKSTYIQSLYLDGQKTKAKEYFMKNRSGFDNATKIRIAQVIALDSNSQKVDYQFALQECLGSSIVMPSTQDITRQNSGTAGLLYEKIGNQQAAEFCRKVNLQ